MIARLLVFLLALVGCTQYRVIRIGQTRDVTDFTYAVYIDKRFDEVQKRDIRLAFEQWNFSLGGYIQYRVVSEDFDMEPYILEDLSNKVVVLANRSSDASVELFKVKVLGWTDQIGGHVIHIVTDRVFKYDLKVIMMHEIGHSIGLDHVADREDSLMAPYYPTQSKWNCIDRLTMNRVADLYHFNKDFLSWCE